MRKWLATSLHRLARRIDASATTFPVMSMERLTELRDYYDNTCTVDGTPMQGDLAIHVHGPTGPAMAELIRRHGQLSAMSHHTAR